MRLKLKRGARQNFKSLLAEHPDDYMLRYCDAVLNKKLKTGEKIYNAVVRQVNELHDMKRDDFPYYFNFKTSANIIKFAKLMPDVSSRKILPMPLFKGFIYCMIDGWRIKDGDGTRFKRVFLSMARTNGKTDIASTLALRDFLFGQPAASRQILLASNAAKQVQQLYGYCTMRWQLMCEMPVFAPLKRMVTFNTIEMKIPQYNTRLWTMSANGRTGSDSAHPTLAVYDEYHEQKTTEFINTMTSGNVQNPDARLVIISTAGTNPRVPMREEYDQYTSDMEKGNMNPQVLFLVWEQDSDKEATKPDTWIKANPLMEVDVMKRNLTAGLKTEYENLSRSGDLPSFLVKNMNRWQNAKTNAFLPWDVIKKAQRDDDELPSINKLPVYVGFDFSISNDDTSIAFVYPIGDKRFMLQQFSYIPTRVAGGLDSKIKQDGINYRREAEKGWCKITEDRFGKVNQDEVYQWFLDYVEQHRLDVRGVAYDSYHASTFIKSVDAYRPEWKLFPVRQGAISLTEPTKFLQNGVTDGTIIMPKSDKVLEAGLSNAVLTDRDNLLLVDKNLNTAKIDCVDAIIDALYEGMYHYTDFTNETGKDDAFAHMSQDDINQYFANYEF